MTAAAALDTARLKVGVQGEAGCFSHAALRALLDDDAEPCFYPSFTAAVEALEAGATDRLLLPVHNSLAGVVQESLAAIAARDLRVDGETGLPIRLVCAGLPDARLERVTRALSHPVALRQCTRFLAHHPWVAGVPVHDTAGAARLIAEERDPLAVAVTSAEAAARHGLVILARDIQDRADNATTFWLLARRHMATRSTADRVHDHLAAHAQQVPGVQAIRGAISVDQDTSDSIARATADLLGALLDANAIGPADVVSTIFTLTPDLTAIFPANPARQLGWHSVPMLCASEIAVPDALPRCLRTLLHVRPPHPEWRASHVYLGEAKGLRPDL
jgi:monofunctional chorismate mutase